MSVERVRVGDVLKLERRTVGVEPDAEYEQIGVRSFGRGIFHKEPVSGVELGNKRVFRIEPADLVLSNVFAWEGAVALATNAETGKIGSHRFMTFTATNNRIDLGWARWWFLSEPGLELIRQASPGSAGRNRTLAIDRFEALEIPLPPIDEQRRVSAHLDRVHAATSEIAARSDRAESLTSALAVSLVMRPEISEKDRSSQGWIRVPIARVLELNSDEHAVDPSTTYEIAGIYSYGRGMFRRAVLNGADTKYKMLYRVSNGQIVMSRLKAWEGALALVPPDIDGYFISPEFPTFDVDVARADPEYIGALVSSERFWACLKGASKGIGARRERVNAARLLEQVVDLPPIEVQRSAARTLKTLDAIRGARSAVAERAAALVPAALNEVFGSLR